MSDSTDNLPYLISQGFSRTIITRFWKHVRKTDGCWLWTAATAGKGYGVIGVGKYKAGMDYAHRISWMIHFGAIPEGLFVLHNCPGGDNPLCVRPDHLFTGTAKQNSQDMVSKGRHKNHPILTVESVLEIRSIGSSVLQRELANRFGVTQNTISRILSRKRWSHVR